MSNTPLEPGQTWKHTDEISGQTWRSRILAVWSKRLPYSNETIVEYVSTSPDGYNVSSQQAESAYRRHWTELESVGSGYATAEEAENA